ncbi:respiratory nitrate reductase subunit gamma [Hoeflea prorocentri]|uniref:nitrate reductase (quinone) n=1 Tax=Hoeflea prorocentri TaxID=1922333 RepID=A0A9X3UF61_9HYPH|nr:respiratory nitrate reductase subunit gamma [Hoeflea prorocentri]MCY6380162.1 respiratory nitrate reductase subunit gamma [Hoeflea prorocentri]MDA5397962.1 respiratory nitrate reductase subunit gamma [Hoeflea prorocentri]
MSNYLNTLLFTVYPYVALAIMIIGCILRYDREPYSWRSGSSQLLRRKQLVWGSVLFHVGILFLFFGHFVGLLTPHFVYAPFISAEAKQMLAIVAGSIAGIICFIGLTMLIHRRFFDERIRATSTFADNAILIILWMQLVLGLITVPYSLQHADGSVMLALSEWAQRILTLRIDGTAELVAAQSWPYQLHILLGLTIFLIFPFSRLVHMLSAPIRYLWRPGYQVVRERNRRENPNRIPAE